ncbi:hypothetical protein Tsubulata_041609 [Turnera subulata]|uniref:Uncharacterized protein n=1 Tax=Turnera subulata TaxID=218843 RepID=A0A9Q0G3Y5_9ROSI|nr:hypothetical protein Tsubulata_041609 [Turnera subulata]
MAATTADRRQGRSREQQLAPTASRALVVSSERCRSCCWLRGGGVWLSAAAGRGGLRWLSSSGRRRRRVGSGLLCSSWVGGGFDDVEVEKNKGVRKKGWWLMGKGDGGLDNEGGGRRSKRRVVVWPAVVTGGACVDGEGERRVINNHSTNSVTVSHCFILGDVTYGPCCVEHLSTFALRADPLIRYGHSYLVPIDATKITKVAYLFSQTKEAVIIEDKGSMGPEEMNGGVNVVGLEAECSREIDDQSI